MTKTKLGILLGLILLVGCQEREFEVVQTKHHVIDSVWKIPPGHLSTMQLNTLYCYEIEGNIIRTQQKIKVGDTIFFYYLKSVKDTLK